MDDDDFSSSAWADAPTSPLPLTPNPPLPSALPDSNPLKPAPPSPDAAEDHPSSPSHNDALETSLWPATELPNASPLTSPLLPAPSAEFDDYPPSPSPNDFDDFADDAPPTPVAQLSISAPAFTSLPPPPLNESEPGEDDGFDDFDDEPAAVPIAVSAEAAFGEDDDFGDFGDFDEVGGVATMDLAGVQGEGGFDDFGHEEEEVPAPTAAASRPDIQRAQSSYRPALSWPPLSLTPSFPDPSTLASTVQEILTPIFPELDPEVQLGGEDVREVEGLGQVLVEEESRKLYTSLTTPPALAPLDWTRSRVRREHLISLGVPVNLDEVSTSRPVTLPTLQITTSPSLSLSSPSRLSAPSSQHPHRASSPLARVGSPSPRPTSTPPIPRPPNIPRRSNTTGSSAFHAVKRRGADSSNVDLPLGSGSSTPSGPGPGRNADLGRAREKTYGLGKKPEFDMENAIRLVDDNSPDDLPLLPLPSLQSLSASLTEATSSASIYLSYLLQLRDNLREEALVSNGMIGDLVMNAQRTAMAGKANGAGSSSSGGGGWRRSVMGGGGSGRASPG